MHPDDFAADEDAPSLDEQLHLESQIEDIESIQHTEAAEERLQDDEDD